MFFVFLALRFQTQYKIFAHNKLYKWQGYPIVENVLQREGLSSSFVAVFSHAPVPNLAWICTLSTFFNKLAAKFRWLKWMLVNATFLSLGHDFNLASLWLISNNIRGTTISLCGCMFVVARWHFFLRCREVFCINSELITLFVLFSSLSPAESGTVYVKFLTAKVVMEKLFVLRYRGVN